MDYVGHLHGDHLDWLLSRLRLLLVVGQGQWEDTTGSLECTRASRRRAGIQGSSMRARRLGVRRPPRLGELACPTRAPPPEVLLTTPTHLIGLLLGTEEDWPRAFETLVERLGPIRHGGTTTG